MNKRAFRLILTVFLVFSMLFSNTAMSFAEETVGLTDDITGNGSALTEEAVISDEALDSAANTEQGTNIKLIKGQTYQILGLSYYVSPSVTVFSIDSKGNLKGVKEGTGKFSISGGGDNETINVEVSGKADPVVDTVNNRIIIGKGKKVSLPALCKLSITDAKDSRGNIVYKNKDIKKIGIIKSGKLTAYGKGVLNLSLEGLLNNKYTVTIEAPVLSKSKVFMKPGDTFALSLSGTSLPVSWMSSNPEIISVSDGTVKAYSVGNANVTAMVNGVSFTSKITCKSDKRIISAERVYLNRTGSGSSKTVKIPGINSKNINWSSADEKIVKVSNGKLTAGSQVGVTTVTAAVKNGRSYSLDVYVFDVSLPNKDSRLDVEIGNYSNLTVDFGDGGNLSDEYPGVVWKSSKPLVAAVNNGSVYGVQKGVSKLTATVMGKKLILNAVVGNNSDSAAHTHNWVYDQTKGLKHCEGCGAWEKYTYYTIKFDSKGGSAVADITVNAGDTAADKMPSDPVLDGYTFIGWYMDSSYSSLFNPRRPVTKDMTLYANWEKIPAPIPPQPDPPEDDENVTVTFDLKGGTADARFAPVTMLKGSVIGNRMPTVDPVKSGSVFLGWYLDEQYTKLFEERQPINENTTLYASWDVIPTNVEGDITNPGFDDDSIIIDRFWSDTVNIQVGNTGEDVVFKAELFSQNIVTDKVEVINKNGTTETSVLELRDDGTGPDDVENDGIFSGKTKLSSSEQGYREYFAKCKNTKSDELEIFFYEDSISDSDVSAARSLAQALNSLTTADAVKSKLEEEGSGVEIQSIVVENDQVLYRMNSGIIGFWSKYSGSSKGQATLDNNSGIVTSSGGLSYGSVRTDLNNKVLVAANSKTKICSIRPFRNTDFKYDDFKTIGDLIVGEIGSGNETVTESFDDNSAKRNEFKNFKNYGVVLIDSHGTFVNFPGNNTAWNGFSSAPYILTGETITARNAATSADYQSGRIVMCSGGGNGGVVAVGPKFFDDYYNDGDLTGTMFYLGSCHSMKNAALADALIGKGAEAVYGYDDTVSTGYCNDTAFEVMLDELLLKAGSAEDAFNNAKTTCAGSHSGNAANLVFKGKEDYHLVRDETPEETPAVPESTDPGAIAGRVYAYGGASIPNALVRIRNNYGTEVARTRVSSTDGNFLQGQLPPGTYSVTVSAYGYISETIHNVVVTSGNTTYISTSIMLRPSNSSTGIHGRVTSSMDGSGVPYAQIRFRVNHDNREGAYLQYADTTRGDVVIYTDQNGNYSFNSLPQGYYTLECRRNGYITGYRNIIATEGNNAEQNLSLTPNIYGAEALRIVLEWGLDPRDLDSHLVGPRPGEEKMFHTWYGQKIAYKDGQMIANLDLDDVTSYGPETTRVYEMAEGTYTFYVHHYSGAKSIAESEARVQVYDQSGLIGTFYAPTNQGTAKYWNVFSYTYNGTTGRGSLRPLNTIADSPSVSIANCYNGSAPSNSSSDSSSTQALGAASNEEEPEKVIDKY